MFVLGCWARPVRPVRLRPGGGVSVLVVGQTLLQEVDELVYVFIEGV